jgi:NAD(P)-dependent dehydrogenase (short-subunit alcohol dehydrogenase family)
MRVAVFDVVADDPVDVTSRSSIEAATERVIAEHGVPHLLVNNAALDSPPDAPPEEVGPFETYPEESFDRVMDVNVKGTLLCCQVVGAAMAREGRGSIVNVSSVYGLLSPQQDVYEFRRREGQSFAKPVAYSVSKSAILNLTRYLATYWAKDGVRVNTLTLAGVANDQPDEFLKAYTARVPLGRMAEAGEALGAVVFLASDASSYMTGANLVVDGGWSAW